MDSAHAGKKCTKDYVYILQNLYNSGVFNERIRQLCQNMNIPYASYYHSGSSQDVFYKQTKKKRSV